MTAGPAKRTGPPPASGLIVGMGQSSKIANVVGTYGLGAKAVARTATPNQARDLLRTDRRLAWLANTPEPSAVSLALIFKLALDDEFALTSEQLRRLLINIAESVGDSEEHRRADGGALSPRELLIRTPADLARALKLAMERSGLGPGQVAAKTEIHRSQIYHLSNPDRNALPHTHDQLLICLRSTRMPPRQIDFVLLQWLLLRERRRLGLPLQIPNPTVSTDLITRPPGSDNTTLLDNTPTRMPVDKLNFVDPAPTPSPAVPYSAPKVAGLWAVIGALFVGIVLFVVYFG